MNHSKLAGFGIPFRDKGYILCLVKDEKCASKCHHGIVWTNVFPIYVSPCWVKDLGGLISRWAAPYTYACSYEEQHDGALLEPGSCYGEGNIEIYWAKLMWGV